MIEDSDRGARLSRIEILANKTFRSRTQAKRWLRRPLAALGGETPLAVAQTEAGARAIETILGKIDWGAAA
jgi:putative toxin-antitoxin system antitoxin component (TIGR02293 family)